MRLRNLFRPSEECFPGVIPSFFFFFLSVGDGLYKSRRTCSYARRKQTGPKKTRQNGMQRESSRSLETSQWEKGEREEPEGAESIRRELFPNRTKVGLSFDEAQRKRKRGNQSMVHSRLSINWSPFVRSLRRASQYLSRDRYDGASARKPQ